LELRPDYGYAVTVGCYNVVPDASFSHFKHDLLQLAKRAL
jgi:hypothetical protein